jgi:hypothetical protein
MFCSHGFYFFTSAVELSTASCIGCCQIVIPAFNPVLVTDNCISRMISGLTIPVMMANHLANATTFSCNQDIVPTVGVSKWVYSYCYWF